MIQKRLFIADRLGQRLDAGTSNSEGVLEARLSEGRYYLGAEPVAPGVYRSRYCLSDCDVTNLGAPIDIVPGQTVEVTLEEPRGDLFIEWLQPRAGPPEGGNLVTLRGFPFSATTTVTFGGVPAIVRAVEGRDLIVEVPPRMRDEVVDVVASSPNGWSDAISYRYVDGCVGLAAAPRQEVFLAGRGEVRANATGSGPIRYEWFLGGGPTIRTPLGTGEHVTLESPSAAWVRLTNPCSSLAVIIHVRPLRGRSAGH